MTVKNICPVHHYRYSGSRCPVCERERINNMVKRFIPKIESVEQESETEKQVDSNLDWINLADKFNIKGL